MPHWVIVWGDIAMSYELWVLVITSLMLLALYLMQGAYTTVKAPKWGISARDEVGAPSVFSGRAERTVRNHIEALMVFAPLVLVAHLAGVSNSLTVWGAGLFLGSRLLFVPLYLLGVPALRTLVWFGGVVGTVLIGYALLTA